MKKPRIGISIGDLNGVGAEVTIKAIMDKRMMNFFTPVIYGSVDSLKQHIKKLRIKDFKFHAAANIDEVKDGICNVIDAWFDEVNLNIGKPEAKVGKLALDAFDAAILDLFNQSIHGMVTAPLNKNLVNSKELPFHGQTEYLADKFAGSTSLMMLVNEGLRVGLVTNHEPISKVSSLLTQERIEKKIAVMLESLKQDFGISNPKLAVLGLNPHASDGGLFGTEEQEVIKPAIEKYRKQNKMVFGPYPADGFFGNRTYAKFDGVLAMYHDQGLVAFKALSFGKGVNFTAGLPVVRTSPDHGTAYDIAGKGIASEDSMRTAMYTALDILRNRADYSEMYANPLLKRDFVQKEEVVTEAGEVKISRENNNAEQD